MDKSTFRGEVVQDEETRVIFNEGQGRISRQTEVHKNYCYYDQIIGNWYHGILHGKRVEYRMNLDIFPVGYYASYFKKISGKINSLNIVQEVKKGIHYNLACCLQ